MTAYRAIDADGHVDPALAADWKQYVEAPHGEKVDKIAKRQFGLSGHGSSTQRGAWDPTARLGHMDQEGIEAAVLFGSSKGVEALTGGDAAMAPAAARGFNNWLHDYCAIDPRRLKLAAWLPLDDVAEACKEARRAVTDLAAAGLVLLPFTRSLPMDDTSFFPLYAEAEALDAPLLIHAPGELRRFAQERYETQLRRHALSFPVSLMTATMDVVCGGLLERFPRLRVAFLEGGVGWLPWWLDRLDEHYEKLPHEAPHIAEKPRDLVRRYVAEGRLFWSCEPEETYLPLAVQEVGEEAIVFASDYPHWDCTFPGAVDLIARRVELSDGAKEKILRGNALRLYGKRVE